MGELVYYTNEFLTGGKPVRILPLNVAGEKAVIELQLKALERGDAVPTIRNALLMRDGIETLECIVYHTLARVLDDITPAAVSKHLDGPTAAELSALIAKVNGWNAADPKAQPTEAPVA